MAKRVVRRTSTDPGSLGTIDVVATFKQYVTLDKQADLIKGRQDDLKKRLKSAIEVKGYEDDKGHKYFDFGDDEVPGFRGLKSEKRVYTTLDESVAEKILADKGILEQCQKTIVVLDEEEILKARYADLLTDDDIDAMYETKVSFAFKPLKG